jgi:uncharacterized protein YuzE
MNIKFDKEADALYVRFSSAEVATSEESKPGIIMDYDAEGNIVGIEMLNASQKVDKPASVVYELS